MIFERRKAVTLVEITIGIVLTALLLGGVMQLFSSGMKDTAKALTHQDNMEAANILMTQIEYDLLRATKIESPNWNVTDEEGAASWYIQDSDDTNNNNNDIKITYSINDGDGRTGGDGILRDDGTGKKHVFAKGHAVKLKFTHFAVDTSEGNENDKLVEKHGMWVELTVYSKAGNYNDDDDKSFDMRRLIVVRRPF